MNKNKKRKNKYYILVIFLLTFVLWMVFATDIIVKLNGADLVKKCSLSDFLQKDDVIFAVDIIAENGDMLETVSIQGWSFVETDTDNTNRETRLVFENEKNAYEVLVKTEDMCTRTDVLNVFSDKKFGINKSVAFIYEFSTLQMKNGIYNIYICLGK